MEEFIYWFNDLLWSEFVLVPLLAIVSLYFTFRTKGIQFTMLGDTFRNLKSSGDAKEGNVSSLQAFAVGLASRIGTGNLAGVAIALVSGGPGAIFWMWMISLFGAVNSFVESTLAQVYKVRDKEVGYRGGPAYYMKYGLKKSWVATLFAGMLVSLYALSLVALQSNTISTSIKNVAVEYAPNLDGGTVLLFAAIGLAAFTAFIIFILLLSYLFYISQW